MAANGAPLLISLNGLEPDKFATKLLPEAIARENMVLPLWLEDGQLLVACAAPSDRAVLKQVEIACRRPVRALNASYADLQAALDKCYNTEVTRVELPDFGRALYQLGYVSSQTLTRLRSLQFESGKWLAQLCHEQNLVNDDDLAEAAAFSCSLPHLRLRELEISNALSILLPWEVATRRKVLPLWWLAGTLFVGVTPDLQPGDRLEDIFELLGVPIQPLMCSYPEWDHLYRRFYLRGRPNTQQQDLEIARRLVRRGALSDLDLKSAQAVVLQTDHSLDDIVITKGIVTRSEWMNAQSEISKILLAPDLDAFQKDPADMRQLASILPEPLASRFLVLPIQQEESKLIVAIARPDPDVIRLIESLTSLQLVPYLLAPDEIKRRLEILYQRTSSHFLRPILGLGKLLLTLGILTKDQYEEAQSWDVNSDQKLGEELIRKGYLDEVGLAEALSLQTGLPYLRLDHVRFEHKYYSEVPAAVAQEHLALPLWSNDRELWVAITDPWDYRGLKRIEEITGKRILPILSPRSPLLAAVERLLKSSRSTADPRALKLIQRLVGGGYLTQIGAAEVLRVLSREGVSLDKAIAGASPYPPEKIARVIAEMNDLPFVTLQLEEETVTRIDPLGQEVEKKVAHDPVDEQAATLVSLEDAKRFSALPIRFSGNSVVVAFADPLFTEEHTEIEKKLSRKIIPVAAYREDLQDAIERVLGKRNIGTFLLLDGIISRSQLNDALDLARNTGVRLGHALVNRGYVTENQLYRYLARQTSLPFYDLQELEIDEKIANRISPEAARKYGILPVRDTGKRILVATVDPLNSQALDEAKGALGADIQLVLITERDFDQALEGLFSQEYLARSVSELLERTPEDSAFRVLNAGQVIILVLFLLMSAGWLWFDFTSYFIFLNSISTMFYIAFSGYKFYLVYRALSNTMEVSVNPEDLDALNDRDLPIYTLLVPVYKEAEVLPELLGALNKLDYPTTKLDIQILMEEDDQDTIDAFNHWSPPSHFHGVVVPYGGPKTKPKACNYGLIHARGDYVVIFDAEDIPESDQLKKILVAFSKSPPQVACIQSKLNYYNSEQNLLTQWFTVEYSMWFDLFLPGLSASRAPIPLGGTSNHFKRDVLVEVGAWDPYNVTEDADLGVRLFKRGYKAAIVDSTTFEEANSRLYNWVRQRSRWIKGYIQTWLVHMRNPVRLIREIGIKAFFSFHFVVGGTFFAALLNPVYWMLTTLWFLVQWKFIEVVFPGVIYFLGALALFIGNFAFTYMNVAGALRRGQYGMVKYALLSPIYWALASVAAWMGFAQLLYKPHFWEKTTHGLHREEVRNAPVETQT